MKVLPTPSQQKLKIVQVDINKLKPADYNPRFISDSEYANLLKSLRVHTLVEPLIANINPTRAYTLISGHQRHRALKELGYKTVPVIFLDLDEEQERALNLRLNRIAGEFDMELLKNYDIETLLDTGFDDTDLGDVWNDALGIDEDDFDEEEAVKKAAETTIKPGDLFALGEHRLYCADSTNPKTIKRLVGDLKPTVFYTDAPFNIGLDYDKGVGLKAKYGGNTNDRKSDVEYTEFLSKILNNSLVVMADDAHVFMYCDQNYIGLVQALMARHGLINRRVCLWVKNGFTVVPQVAFNKGYEPVIYSTRGKPYLSPNNQNLTEILNRDIATGNRTADDILDIFDIWLARRDPGQEYQHPAQKPLSLHEKPLKRCTKVGDIILDCCGGSGSTLLSCEQMKRVALIAEIEPVFCQVIIDRYELLTGKKAVRL